MKLILASKSPRRKELLSMITPDFSIAESDFDEKEVPVCEAEQYVQQLAKGKATHADAPLTHDGIIIGCDTVVVAPDGRIFGKPADEAEGYAMLRELSGNVHRVITGVCLHNKSKTITFAVTAYVTFYPLSDEEICDYLACGEYQDKAGAYGIQGKGGLLCEKIEGDYFNIVGLPVARLSRELKSFEKQLQNV